MLKARFPEWSAAAAAAVAIGATVLLVACGGGGEAVPSAGTATPTSATTYTQGVISGFGSVIVGGIRYDDSLAKVLDEEGRHRDRGELRLGMVVEVEAGNVDRPAASARALQIRWGSEIVGPVGGIDTVASTVEVLGQTVLVTSSTVFDETLAGGLAALRAGDVVEVHGILDPANGRIVATRIEAEAGATAYKLRGPIADLDTAAKTFALRGVTVWYGGTVQYSGGTEASLANGQRVEVKGALSSDRTRLEARRIEFK